MIISKKHPSEFEYSIGTAQDMDGQTLQLSATEEAAPVVTLANGTTIEFEWYDLLALAASSARNTEGEEGAFRFQNVTAVKVSENETRH